MLLHPLVPFSHPIQVDMYVVEFPDIRSPVVTFEGGFIPQNNQPHTNSSDTIRMNEVFDNYVPSNLGFNVSHLLAEENVRCDHLSPFH